jgi:hypothetical protein
MSYLPPDPNQQFVDSIRQRLMARRQQQAQPAPVEAKGKGPGIKGVAKDALSIAKGFGMGGGMGGATGGLPFEGMSPLLGAGAEKGLLGGALGSGAETLGPMGGVLGGLAPKFGALGMAADKLGVPMGPLGIGGGAALKAGKKLLKKLF